MTHFNLNIVQCAGGKALYAIVCTFLLVFGPAEGVWAQESDDKLVETVICLENAFVLLCSC